MAINMYFSPSPEILPPPLSTEIKDAMARCLFRDQNGDLKCTLQAEVQISRYVFITRHSAKEMEVDSIVEVRSEL